MGVDSMLNEGQRYYFKTNDGSEVCGTIYRVLTNGRMVLEDVDILTELGTAYYLEQITLYNDDVAQIYDYDTDERIY